MLRIYPSKNPEKAKDYFRESLSRGDYYRDEQEMPAQWGGILATELALGEQVDQSVFYDLCSNRFPGSKVCLTPRTRMDRRVGYDLTYNVPKSVTLCYELGGDTRIFEAVLESARETQLDAQALMRTRVRVKGQNSDRVTGNALWASFPHTTARPVLGIPDPHLHIHFYTFNLTKDPVEGKFKAGEFVHIKRQAPLLQARFLLRLGSRLNRLGYELYQSGKFWEIDGISLQLVTEFSKRTAEINKLAEKLGYKHRPDLKGDLGRRTREQKVSGYSFEELRADWKERAGEEGLKAISQTVEKAKSRGGVRPDKEDAAALECVRFTIRHVFEQKSAVREEDFLQECCKRATGRTTLEAVEAAIRRTPFIKRTFGGSTWVTTAEVLAEEQRMISFFQEGRGKSKPVVIGPYEVRDKSLNNGQRAAVRNVLNSYDRVTFIVGSPGSGKTRLMREAISEIKRAGIPVMVLSPLSNAARQTLPKEGFKDADTVAGFVLKRHEHEKIRNGFLWIDEAGLLGTRAVNQLFDLATRYNCRLVLSGGPNQHKPQERGDAIRILIEEGGAQAAEVSEILRQKGEYKQACEHLSKGDIVQAWKVLEKMGSIVETKGPDAIVDAHRQLAKEYVKSRRSGRKPHAIAPTHVEGESVTRAIRIEMANTGFVRFEEKEFLQLKPLNLSDAQKRDPDSYKPGMIVEFHGKSLGKSAGDRGQVVGVKAGVVFISGGLGTKVPIPLKLSDSEKFSVFEQSSIKLAIGDEIRFTKNGRAVGDLLNFLPDRRNPLRSGRQLIEEIGEAIVPFAEKKIRPNPKRLVSGARARIIGLTPVRNDFILANGFVVDRNFGHLTHGYCSTSKNSQSGTHGEIFIAQTSMSFGPASSQEQALVSVTRGSLGCKIFTDDKVRLRDEWHRSESRLSASEMLSKAQDEILEGVIQQRAFEQRAKEADKGAGFDYEH